MQRPVLAQGDHVVDALANGLGPHQRGRDSAVTDDLETRTKDKRQKKHERVIF